MNFTPAPPNDFPEFIQTYYERCRERVPAIEGIAGKWTLEDLLPGFSDFDSRFLVRDGLSASDWCAMAMEVAHVHYELAREFKHWARTLEHLPGVNLAWSELLDPEGFYTEFLQWSFYDGDAGKLEELLRYLGAHQWNRQDEEYHWKKIAIYYGPYNRAIDPAINLGAYEDRYPLHSRLMHYLTPPVHSAVCLMQKETTPGKLDAFRRARELFPQSKTMERVLALIEDEYRAPELLREPGLTEFDRELEIYLEEVVDVLLQNSDFLDCPPRPDVTQLQDAVRTASTGMASARDASAPGLAILFENLKFARLMKGRLWFYAQELPWFESGLLIRNELNRMRANFYETPLRHYAKLCFHETLDAEECLQRLQNGVLDSRQVEACRHFAILADPICPDEELKLRALQMAERYEPFLEAMEAVVQDARDRMNSLRANH